MQDASDSADNAAQSAATFTTDPTLTISGKAADAKATGDQLSDLKSALETVEGATALGLDTLLPLAWESGSLNTTDGSEEADVSRRRTDYIPVIAESIYVTYESPVSGFMVFWYDASKNYISGSQFLNRQML
jgi:hypothetical protein